MSLPLLFISHKHEDRLIAEQVANFVRSITGGQVDVYLSSNPEFAGPRVGKNLNDELRSALWRAGIVVLIYTAEDKDWSWCMWECGLAEDRNSPDTKVVVLQCLQDKPKVFQSGLHVKAWEKDSLISFAYRFRESGFFPGVEKPVTYLREKELNDRALNLHEDLQKVISTVPTENWAAWPFLRLEVPRTVINALTANGTANAQNTLLENASIVGHSAGLPNLFGRAEIALPSPFADLYKEWMDRYPDRPPGWWDTLANQILAGARKRSPRVERWDRFRAFDSDDEYVPSIGRIKSNSVQMHFDCYFLSVGKIPQISMVMTILEEMYYLELTDPASRKTKLCDILTDKEHRWSRIPVLEDKKAKYIIHVSMIDRFVREKAYAGHAVENLTLDDLLAEKEMERLFANSFAFISSDQTIDDAHKAMTAIRGCEDVFVTENGQPNEQIQGWLTNKDITRLLTGRLVTH
ncbi:MAG TPA: toll/interleukin-1 receptor domain-containing protein [Blastocatellia bacterium]|nr:toll/interleukin-1 receptor domain-containing protein [Blastocatellia bacterium]